jgi:septal ring factor EnvC (AmiA/AmiB activator)
MIVSILLGAVIGYMYYMKDNRNTITQVDAQEEENALPLEEQQEKWETEKKDLEAQIAELNDRVRILSETINQKTASENELIDKLAQMSTPTGFPLKGSATMEEVTEKGTEGTPICIFTATAGITAVATASGTVTAITEDFEYGHNVWIDHGNGYVTVYRNQGEVYVKTGDAVAFGTTIYLIGRDNTKFGYQMMKDGDYINPMDMLKISG